MKKYSKEFKEEALKLSDEIGIKIAASQLGLQYYTLVEWRKNRKAETKLNTEIFDFGSTFDCTFIDNSIY